MAAFERSAEANKAITEIRSYLRRIEHLTKDLDWFESCFSSKDEENIPLLLEKVKQSYKILQDAMKL
jgi:hypothetical protein